MMPNRERTFPRGLVLGLTMAETAILIIFVLLLALTALLDRETDRRRTAEEDLEQFEDIRRVLTERGLEPEAVQEAMGAREEDRRDADDWRELVRNLDRQVPDLSPQTIASRLQEATEALERDAAHAVLDEVLRAAGVEPTPDELQALAEVAEASHEADLTREEVRDAIETYPALDEELRARGGETTPGAVERMVRDAQRWREYAGESVGLAAALDRANQRIERLEAQVRGGGGTDHPSCWYDDDNSVAYLFDVALTEAGYLLQPARAPRHERERAALGKELAPIRTGRPLTPAQFREQTRPVYEWSVANDCRFFVRAFDVTAPDQKELYKDRMWLLERHFYKYANPSGPPPQAGSAPRP